MDTYASSYSRVASQEAGAVADQAERRKVEIHSNMDPNMYLFAPVVIETSGVFGKQTLSFLKDLACRICKASGEVQSFSYLLQLLVVAVQRGNAVSVLGTFDAEDCLVFEDSDTYSVMLTLELRTAPSALFNSSSFSCLYAAYA